MKKKIQKTKTVKRAKSPPKKKASKPRVSKIEKPYNGGTMSKAAFFAFLRNGLRRMSMYWKDITIVRNAAKRNYKGPNKRQKYSYECGECHLDHFSIKEIAVHHKIECGTLKEFSDLPGFVERLFCTAENLIVLCESCHSKKHKK